MVLREASTKRVPMALLSVVAIVSVVCMGAVIPSQKCDGLEGWDKLTCNMFSWKDPMKLEKFQPLSGLDGMTTILTLFFLITTTIIKKHSLLMSTIFGVGFRMMTTQCLSKTGIHMKLS